jgi:serine/threonine protein kinase
LREGCRIEYFDWIFDLNEYEAVEQIGEKGQVWLWRHRGGRGEIAVKSFAFGPDSVKNEEIRRNFMREVERLITLSHPCIVSLKGCCLPSENEGPRIVTEFLGNGSLKPILASGSKSPRWWTDERKVTSIAGIVLGMKFSHSKGLIHGNLKPENILLDDDLRIRIADFGSSRISQADLTLSGAEALFYMAPEVGDHHYDEKVDVYSFGIILYEIVVGDALFSGPGNKLGLLVNLQNGWRPKIPDSVKPVSKELIEKCWSVNPKDRPGFDEIWSVFEELGFQLLPGVNSYDIDGFTSWFRAKIAGK